MAGLRLIYAGFGILAFTLLCSPALAERQAYDNSICRESNIADALLADYCSWRASIPDFDRRLYERTKSAEKKARLAMTYSAIAVVLVLLSAAWLSLLILRRSTAGGGDIGADSVLMRRQAELHRALSQLRVALDQSRDAESRRRVEAMMASAERTLMNLDEAVLSQSPER